MLIFNLLFTEGIKGSHYDSLKTIFHLTGGSRSVT